MKKAIYFTLCLLVAFSFADHVFAETIVSQTEFVSSESLYDINYGQSFVAPSGITDLNKITLKLEKQGSPTGNMVVELFNASTTNQYAPMGAVLQTVTKDVTTVATSPADYDFVFSSPVSITPGGNYFLQFSCATCNGSNNVKIFYETPTDPGYTDGRWAYESGGVWYSDDDLDDYFYLYFTDIPVAPTPPVVASVFSMGGPASSSDMLATAGILFSDLWPVIAIMAGIPLAFYMLTKIQNLVLLRETKRKGRKN